MSQSDNVAQLFCSWRCAFAYTGAAPKPRVETAYVVTASYAYRFLQSRRLCCDSTALHCYPAYGSVHTHAPELRGTQAGNCLVCGSTYTYRALQLRQLCCNATISHYQLPHKQKLAYQQSQMYVYLSQTFAEIVKRLQSKSTLDTFALLKSP